MNTGLKSLPSSEQTLISSSVASYDIETSQGIIFILRNSFNSSTRLFGSVEIPRRIPFKNTLVCSLKPSKSPIVDIFSHNSITSLTNTVGVLSEIQVIKDKFKTIPTGAPSGVSTGHMYIICDGLICLIAAFLDSLPTGIETRRKLDKVAP